jgi:transglutaminase-like putative cysteine protease
MGAERQRVFMRSEGGELGVYLKPGRFIDADHPTLIAFSQRVAGGIRDPRETAVALFYAVRDGFPYDPYRIDLRPEAMLASKVLERGYGFCIPKAMLLAAAARVQHIPSRLGFADVRNHLTTERLRRAMETDVFYYHGFAELHLGGRWVKVTPTFNRALCDKFGVPPLDFDGIHDSVFHAFDRGGNRYMEYLRDHGRYADLPLEWLVRALSAAYPRLMEGRTWNLSGRFEDETVADPDGTE